MSNSIRAVCELLEVGRGKAVCVVVYLTSAFALYVVALDRDHAVFVPHQRSPVFNRVSLAEFIGLNNISLL